MAAKNACIILLILCMYSTANATLFAQYDVQTPQVIKSELASHMGVLTGQVSITYETGGVLWQEIGSKFKSLNMWFINFEPQDYFNGTTNIFYYDRATEKIKGYIAGTGVETTSGITETVIRFNALGQR